MDGYRTIARDSEAGQVIKKSRFTGRAIAASDTDAAIAAINAVKKQHWDATHNCYAYVIGENSDTMRYSDDGEPQGTAGQPILEVITRRGLTNVLVVVTRYFGGTLLGAGGLIRAYASSASDALDEAGVAEYTACVRALLQCDYSLWPKLEQWLQHASCHVEDVEYAGEVSCTLAVRENEYAGFTENVTDFSNARAELVEIERAVIKLPEL